MEQVSRVALSLAIATAGIFAAAADAAAQSQNTSRPGTVAGRATDMKALLCKDIMRMSGEDRSIALGVLHGYFLGKKGASSYVSDALSKASDDFVEYCLDHPGEKALDVFAKFAM